jgi:hypothetical protein
MQNKLCPSSLSLSLSSPRPSRLFLPLPSPPRWPTNLPSLHWAAAARDAAPAAAEPGRCADAAGGRAAVHVPDATAAESPATRRCASAAGPRSNHLLPTYCPTLQPRPEEVS